MGALKQVAEEEVLESLPKTPEEEEAMALLATLVRAHYLEKSSKFHMAMDFEKLFKLDRLELLKHLEDLDKLDKLDSLDQLKAMDNLKELSKLRELSHLSELKPLQHLDKLEELRELSKLDRLNSLYALDKLGELQNLDSLKNLRELDKLQSIQTLNKLLETHSTTLQPLEHLDKLMELVHLAELKKLEELKELDKLKDLQKLDKLDRINDARFAERLDKLDKLNILEKGTRILIFHQIIGFGLELFKFILAGVLVAFLLSRETGREIAVKALPALGFGNGAQVNLGLKLLVGETSPEDFQVVISDVRKRMDAEIETAFSSSSLLTLKRRLELIGQVQSYSYQGAGIHLSEEAKKKLQDKLAKYHENAVSRLEFDMSIARGKQDTDAENKLREVKLLLIQKQYPQLFEKSIPMWGAYESVNMAAITGAAALKIEDPKTLEELMQKMPGNGAF